MYVGTKMKYFDIEFSRIFNTELGGGKNWKATTMFVQVSRSLYDETSNTVASHETFLITPGSDISSDNFDRLDFTQGLFLC